MLMVSVHDHDAKLKSIATPWPLSTQYTRPWQTRTRRIVTVTKNCCMTYVKIRKNANFVLNLLVYLVSVASQCIFSCLRLLL